MATIATPVFEEEYAGGTIARAQVGLWRDGFRRLRRNRLALAALVYLILLLAGRDRRDLLDAVQPGDDPAQHADLPRSVRARIRSAPTSWGATC